jgi:hypothetical protein
MSNILIKILIFICMVFNLIASRYIIPYTQNPLEVKSLRSSLIGQSLIFKFKIPEGSAGLNYKEYFGIVFPSDFYISNASLSWSCSLTDGMNALAITGISLNASHNLPGAENNIAYCRLDEMDFIPLKSQYTYTLTVSLVNNIVSTQL